MQCGKIGERTVGTAGDDHYRLKMVLAIGILILWEYFSHSFDRLYSSLNENHSQLHDLDFKISTSSFRFLSE